MHRISSRFDRFIMPALAGLALAITLPVAHADVVYSTGFENPPFVTGPIAGQDGWSVFGPGLSTVENLFVKTGSQAVFVDGNTASQSGPFHSDVALGPLVELSADIAIFTSTSQSEWQFAALGPGGIGFLGGIDVFFDNSIEAITNGFPVLGTFPRATAFDSTAWHHIDLLFNMPSQTYDVSLDGVALASNVAFCGDNGPCAGAPVTSYGLGFFDNFGATSTVNGGPANDSGYIDNFAVANVPEPTTIILIAIGLVGVIAGSIRRRSR